MLNDHAIPCSANHTLLILIDQAIPPSRLALCTHLCVLDLVGCRQQALLVPVFHRAELRFKFGLCFPEKDDTLVELPNIVPRLTYLLRVGVEPDLKLCITLVKVGFPLSAAVSLTSTFALLFAALSLFFWRERLMAANAASLRGFPLGVSRDVGADV